MKKHLSTISGISLIIIASFFGCKQKTQMPLSRILEKPVDSVTMMAHMKMNPQIKEAKVYDRDSFGPVGIYDLDINNISYDALSALQVYEAIDSYPHSIFHPVITYTPWARQELNMPISIYEMYPLTN